MCELEYRNKLDKYTLAKVKKMLQKVAKLRQNVAYKQKIFCRPRTRKTAELLEFMADARETVRKVYSMIDSHVLARTNANAAHDKPVQAAAAVALALSLSDEWEVQTAFKLPTVAKTTGKQRVRARSADLQERNLLVNSKEYRFFDGDCLKHFRGKSCCCGDCGGLRYYLRVQRRINAFQALPRLLRKKRKHTFKQHFRYPLS